MEEEIKRRTARRKASLVLDIIQRKVTVAEASRQFDLTPAEIGSWVDDGKRGMENALRANPVCSAAPCPRLIGCLAPPLRRKELLRPCRLVSRRQRR